MLASLIKPDIVETADKRCSTVSRAKKNKSLNEDRRDISDSSDSSE